MSQIHHLRQQAHQLKPVVIVGSAGVTDAVLQEIDRALFDHELIKVRINAANKEERAKFTNTICTQCQAQLVQSIGHIVTIYRKKVTTDVENKHR